MENPPDWKMAGKSYQNEHDAKSASEAADKSFELILYKIFMTQSNILSRKIVMRLLMKWSRHGRLHPVQCRRPGRGMAGSIPSIAGGPMLALYDEHTRREHTLPIQHSSFTNEQALEAIIK